jgi:hypothetical protein
MQDYAKLYRNKRRISDGEKLRRILKVLSTDLPPMIMVMCIMILVRFKK